MLKFCPGCGLQLIAENLKFCPECGENLSKNQEQYKIKDQKKQQSMKFALKIVGLLSIFIGFVILLAIYIFPVTEILGQEITLAQVHSLCGNVVVNALSVGSCSGVNDKFYFQWAGGAVLIITGLIEMLLS